LETNNENDIEPIAQNLHLSSLVVGLETALIEERAPSPTTPEPLSPSGSQEPEKRGKTQRNTMAAKTEQEEATPSNTTPDLNLKQLSGIITAVG